MKLIRVGKITETITKFIPDVLDLSIMQSEGLKKHIEKRHPECVEYIKLIPSIIQEPDYIGINPNEYDKSFELIKTFSEHIQIGIKIDISQEYYYVATLHTITQSKLERRVKSGRLNKVDMWHF